MINNENQNSYPQINFSGKIHLITNDQELSEIATILSSAQALGFDTETRASFKKGKSTKSPCFSSLPRKKLSSFDCMV